MKLFFLIGLIFTTLHATAAEPTKPTGRSYISSPDRPKAKPAVKSYNEAPKKTDFTAPNVLKEAKKPKTEVVAPPTEDPKAPVEAGPDEIDAE